jgi:phage shock protein PspC (stress-responsive transcriptional regulator)
MESIHDAFRRAGLVRPREGALVGGVCAGFARRLGIDPWPTRILFVALLLAMPGSQILVYPILWVLMPAELTVPATTAMTTGPAAGAPDPPPAV